MICTISISQSNKLDTVNNIIYPLHKSTSELYIYCQTFLVQTSNFGPTCKIYVLLHFWRKHMYNVLLILL